MRWQATLGSGPIPAPLNTDQAAPAQCDGGCDRILTRLGGALGFTRPWAGEHGCRRGSMGQAGGAGAPGYEEEAPAGRSVASPRRRMGKRGRSQR